MDRQRLLRGKVLAAGVALIAPLLGACGDTSGSTGKESNGPITLKLLESQQIRANVLQKLIPQFEAAMAAKGQHITVKLIKDIVPDSNFQTVLTEDYNAKTAPDVSDYQLSWMPDFASAGYLLDLKPYLNKWPGWSQFYPAVKDQMVAANGSVYGLVHEANIQQIFYREDVLKQLGISTQQPQTWTELIARLQQIKAKIGQPPFVIPAGTAWASPEEGLYNVLLGTGSNLYDPKAGRWVVKSAGINFAYNLLATLKNDGLIPTQALLNPNPWEPTKYAAFVKGTMPVTFQGTWGWQYDWGPQGTAPIANLASKVKTWEYPAVSGSPYVDARDGYVWAVSKQTKHPEAAVELAEWLTTGQPLADTLVAVGTASPRQGMDKTAPYSKQPQLLEAERLFSSARALKPESDQAKIDQAFEKGSEAILTGQMNAGQAAALFAQQAKILLGPDRVEG